MDTDGTEKRAERGARMAAAHVVAAAIEVSVVLLTVRTAMFVRPWAETRSLDVAIVAVLSIVLLASVAALAASTRAARRRELALRLALLSMPISSGIAVVGDFLALGEEALALYYVVVVYMAPAWVLHVVAIALVRRAGRLIRPT